MTWMQMIVTIVCSVIASSGFWAFAQKYVDKKDDIKEMLRGLAHNQIMDLGMNYLNRGDWITQDEYENLHDYLYIPYKKLDGNGSAEKVMQDVNKKLRIVPNNYRVEDEL